ncbi:MAG TPA: glutathione S-transferase family protein [Rhizomicrobium sp.]|nr:glutathione S-transferase family protein [Rhizomicrobium sp.]
MARYTLIVGTRNWSSWSLRPFVALKATGAPFEVVDIRLRQTEHPTTREQILQHSVAGKVPVLKIEEKGKVLTVWDSLAICETLAERHPEAGLWPDDPAARATARSYACEMHSGFPDLRDQLTMDFARKKALPELRSDTAAQIVRIIAAWESALATYQGGFLFGRLSVADCMYAPAVSRFDTYGVRVPAPVRAYMDRLIALPAMCEWLEAARTEVEAGLA